MIKSFLASSIILTMCSGCVANFGDYHYFATVRPDTHEVVNVFRVNVSGSAQLTNARYIAGYYDERAVDLFFNEIKPGNTKFFDYGCVAADTAAGCNNKKDAALATVPVGKDLGEQGAFVMILSTDASAISSTIGSFAESNANVQSAMFLANRSANISAQTIRATRDITIADRKASYDTIANVLAVSASSNAQREAKYLGLLQTVAGTIDPTSAPNFPTVADARRWFASRPRKAVP